MFPILKGLKDLHDLDTQVRAFQVRMEEARRALAEREAAVAAEEGALEALRTRDKDARSGLGLKEMELKGLEEQILSWTVKLNTTKDNKEYQAIRHQIGTLKATKGTLEEEILGLMDAGAGVHAGLQAEQRKVEEARQHLERERRTAADAMGVLQAESEALSARRASLAAVLPEDVNSRYDRIRARRDGAGLAEASGGICGGCHMALTLNQANQLVQDHELVACQSCGRILYSV